MKDYIEVKVVEAAPMSRGEYNAYRGWKIPSDENPADELNAPPKMVYRSTVRTALSEELLQGSQRKEQSLLRTVFIGRNTGSAGGLHRDFTGVCQTGRNVLRKGSIGLDVQVNQKAPERI